MNGWAEMGRNQNVYMSKYHIKRKIKYVFPVLRYIRYRFTVFLCEYIVDWQYGSFFKFREVCVTHLNTYNKNVYYRYLDKHCAFIGLNTHFETPPILPHGLHGIHISDKAHIGKSCVIFQPVTIGSNTIKGHPRYGSPHIGDNVFIGAGAKIIGNVTIGNNCRIGANCVVVKDMPENTTAVLGNIRFIIKGENADNQFYGI